MKRSKRTVVFIILALSIAIIGTASKGLAAEDIGSVVALKGSAAIERDAKTFEAKLKEGILLRDTVETRDRSKAKLLFIDDSVLTMGEKARVVIKEFVYSKDKGGRSIFNLIDGKVRSVVGKSEFEVHTPTAIAAARGTVFECETGTLTGGKLFTTCTCFEGVVDIRSIDPVISGRVSLRPGMAVTVMGGQPVPTPSPAPATTTLQSAGVSLTEPGGAAREAAVSVPLTQAPPIIQQPPVLPPSPPPPATTPVNIGIGFPAAPAPAPNTGGIRVGW